MLIDAYSRGVMARESDVCHKFRYKTRPQFPISAHVIIISFRKYITHFSLTFPKDKAASPKLHEPNKETNSATNSQS